MAPSRRIDDAAAIADAVVALHSTDPTSVFLSAASRMAHPSVAAIEKALYEERVVVRHHAMRQTMWVMTPQTAQRAHASSTRKIATAERRRLLPWLEAALQIKNPNQWFEEATERVVDVVRNAGSITTRDVGRALPDIAAVNLTAASGTRHEVKISAHSRLLLLAGFTGRIVRTSPVGTWVSSQYRWAPAEDWSVTDLDELDTKTAASGMLDHYLGRFGPATEPDIVWWTGWTKTQVRQALSDSGAYEVRLDDSSLGWVSSGDIEHVEAPEGWLALLPGLDPTTMGWKEREWFLHTDLISRVFDRNGNAGPTIWLDGNIIGGWIQRPDGEIALELPNGIPASREAELETEIVRLQDFVCDTRFRVRFPSPNQKDLLR